MFNLFLPNHNVRIEGLVEGFIEFTPCHLCLRIFAANCNSYLFGLDCIDCLKNKRMLSFSVRFPQNVVPEIYQFGSSLSFIEQLQAVISWRDGQENILLPEENFLNFDSTLNLLLHSFWRLALPS